MTKRPPSRGAPPPSSNRTTWIIVAVIVAVGLAAVVAVVSTRSTKSNTSSTTAVSNPAAVVSDITGVTDATLTSVGSGGVTTLPKPIQAPALTKDGKPLVLYVGAEYCPFCAAERWAMVQALSRFGTFSGLAFTNSSGNDVYPNTATLTFHGSNYQSSVVAFTGVETQDRDRKTLDTLTSDQQALAQTYNPQGSIPWINFGGKYVLSGASYSPQVLAGKTAEQIGAALADPNAAIAQGVLGTANMMTATICILTNDQPTTACSNPAVQTLEASIKAQ